MPTITPPLHNHRWQPTPSIGRGGTKDGNHTFLCRNCPAKVTKAQLINDEVPGPCAGTRTPKAT